MSAASSISTLSITLEVRRTQQTADAFFGEMALGNEFICYSMERIAVAIPVGSYKARLEYSPHFGRPTPHIDVPGRTYIEIHPANLPSQLEGCIAAGSTIDNGALDNSKAAFDKLMERLPKDFSVNVTSSF